MSQTCEENAVQNSNEVLLKRVKRILYFEYGSVTTKANIDEGCMVLEQENKNLFFKGKPKIQKVEYAQIGSIDVKPNFSIGAAVLGVIIWIVMLGLLTSDEMDTSFMVNAILGSAIAFAGYLIFGTCGKRFMIMKKDGTAVNVFSEGDDKNNKPFLEKLVERGINAQNIKESTFVKKMAYIFAAVSFVFIIIGSCFGNPVDVLLNDLEKTVNEVVKNADEMKRITESGGNASREELLARANAPYQRMKKGLEKFGEIGDRLKKHENNMSLQQQERMMRIILKMNDIDI